MVMEKANQSYEPLAQDDGRQSESIDGIDDESNKSLPYNHRAGFKGSRTWTRILIEGVVVLASVAFGVSGYLRTGSTCMQAGVIDLFFRPETASVRDNNFHWTQHLSGPQSAVYMGASTMERELAWESLLDDRTVSFTAAELQSLNATGEIPSLQDERTGNGNEIGYELMSGMDYQLRCLMLVRQWSHWDYYLSQMEDLPAVFHSSPEDALALVGKFERESAKLISG